MTIYDYKTFYLIINVVCFGTIGILLLRTWGDIGRSLSKRFFTAAVLGEMVFMASDTIWTLLLFSALPVPPAVPDALKFIYFLSTVGMCYCWYMFGQTLLGIDTLKLKKHAVAGAALVYCEAALLMGNIPGHYLFWTEAPNRYHRGPLFAVTWVFAYIYILLVSAQCVRRTLREKDPADRKKFLSFSVLPVFSLAGGIVQFYFPRIPVVCGALVWMTLVLYLDSMDLLISLDPLTGLNNRRKLVQVLGAEFDGTAPRERLFLMMMDLNYFKKINDTYGHLEGDSALVRVSGVLKSAANETMKVRPVIARYGGDEFLILAEGSREDMERLRLSIREKLQKANDEAHAKYPLTLSYGIASAQEAADPASWIEAADQRLYEDKDKQRSHREAAQS